MAQLRKDPVVNRWVVVSTRSQTPREFDFGSAEGNHSTPETCPFCQGNEDKTPTEILAFRKEGSQANNPGWWLRVIPNKFAALQPQGDLNRVGRGMFDLMSGRGAHEVIIETPHHDKDMADYSNDQIEKVLWAYRDRILDLKKDERIKYILIFKNHGRQAGASMAHAHSQVIALPIIPKRVIEEMAGVKLHRELKDRCIYCDIVRQEVATGERIVEENRFFIAITPFASRFPFEMWLVPKIHDNDFTNLRKEQILELASLMRLVLLRLKVVLNDCSYNFVLHTSPSQSGGQDSYHWHIEIIPTLTRMAGFEWGTGFYINPTAPEDAALFLRQAKLPSV